MKKALFASLAMLAFLAAGSIKADTPSVSAPTGLNATVSTSSVALSWATTSEAVVGYNVMRGTSTIATTTQNQYVDTSLTANTSYAYSVSAFDAAGNTSSSSASVTAIIDTLAPNAPTGLAAIVTTSSVALSWDAAIDNVAVAGYNVMRGTSTVATTSSRQYTDSGLAASTSYAYSVSAFDAAGNTSSSSAGMTINTAQPTPIATSTATSSPKKRTKFKGNIDNITKVINIRSNQLVQVHVYGDATLDAANIDMKSVRFAGGSAVKMVLRDLNRDKKVDAIFSFRAKQLTEFNKATSSATTAKLVFSTKDGKTYEQVIKVRVKYWKTEKQRQAEKRQAELKKQAELRKQAEIKKHQEQIKLQAEKKREALKKEMEKKNEMIKKEAEKKREALKKAAEKKGEQIKHRAEKKLEGLKKFEDKK